MRFSFVTLLYEHHGSFDPGFKVLSIMTNISELCFGWLTFMSASLNLNILSQTTGLETVMLSQCKSLGTITITKRHLNCPRKQRTSVWGGDTNIKCQGISEKYL